MRLTVKSYLKTIEKAKTEAKAVVVEEATIIPERTSSANHEKEISEPTASANDPVDTNLEDQAATPTLDVQPSIEVSCATNES